MENSPSSAPPVCTPPPKVAEQKSKPRVQPKEAPLLDDEVKAKNDISVADVNAMIDQFDALESKIDGIVLTKCTIGKSKYALSLQPRIDGKNGAKVIVIGIAKEGAKIGEIANLIIEVKRIKGVDAREPGRIDVTMRSQTLLGDDGGMSRSNPVASIAMNTTYREETANLKAVNGGIIKKQLAKFLPFIMKAEHPASQY